MITGRRLDDSGHLRAQHLAQKRSRRLNHDVFALSQKGLDWTMSVVGVDFGLQTSLIAAAGRGGVDVLLNGASNRLNP